MNIGNSADVKCEKMELKDLIGLKTLTGIINEAKDLTCDWDEDQTYDGQTVSFILDGVTYTAIEDNNDGYRSAMASLLIDKFECSNRFEPIQVLGIYIDKTGSYNSCDLLCLYGMNGQKILTVGTDNTDDYYPSFVSDFQPENIPQ